MGEAIVLLLSILLPILFINIVKRNKIISEYDFEQEKRF